MQAINVQHLNKQYGQKEVLKDLNFSVQQGEFVAIVGKSGSGKSTILNILGLLETADSGDIHILGQPIPKINSRKATLMRRNTINYLFQSFALINNQTVGYNLYLALNFTKHSKQAKHQIIDEILQKLDIVNLKDTLVESLSGGEKQRVALARAIIKPGNIILADEPTGSLDPENATIAFNQIMNIRNQYGKTIVLVTHNMQEAARADRIITIG
jgi:putative ABC transport system ATP-binding protein